MGGGGLGAEPDAVPLPQGWTQAHDEQLCRALATLAPGAEPSSVLQVEKRSSPELIRITALYSFCNSCC